MATASAAPRAASGRFWLLVLVLLMANVAAWIGYHRWYAKSLGGLLRVEEFSPGENAVVEGSSTPFLWRFNLDMAQSDGRPGSVTPAVPGRWEWSSTRTLMFLPDGKLPKATRLTFTLAPEGVRTAQGLTLAQPYVSSVLSSPLSVESVRQNRAEDNNCFVLQFSFSDRVLPADLSQRLQLRHQGRLIPFKVLAQEPASELRVLTEAVQMDENGAETVLVANIARELRGVSGDAGLGGVYEAKIKLERALSITEISARAPAQGQPVVRLEVNGEYDLSLFKHLLSSEPAAEFTARPMGSALELVGDFKPGMRYAIKLASSAELAKRAGIPQPATLSVMVPDRPKAVWFERSEGYLGAEGSRTVMAHAVNVREMRVSLWRVYDNNLVHWRNSAGGSYSWGELSQYEKPLGKRTIRISAAHNEVQDIAISLDDIVPGASLGDGVYRLALEQEPVARGAGDEDEENDRYSGRSVAVVTLSDIGLTAKAASGGEVTVWAVSLRSAKPIGGVGVRLYSSKSQLIAEGTTGEDGLARLKGADLPKGETPSVVLAQGESGKGLTWIDLDSGWDLSDAAVGGRSYLRKGHEAYVYTDRGVYRPGETLSLHALLRDSEMRAPKAFPVKWTLRRPDLHEWRVNATMLDGDGMSEWTLELPADLPTGRWSAMLAVPGDHAAELGEVSFYVEEFVPARLKANIRLASDGETGTGERRLQPLAKKVRAEVQADYLFGRPAEGLGVSLIARLDPVVFAPRQWRGWTFGDSRGEGAKTIRGRVKVKPVMAAAKEGVDDPTTQVDDGGIGESVLDEKGHAVWELPLEEVGGKGLAGAYRGPWRLSVAASVKETGGRAVTVWDSANVDVLNWYIGVRQTEEQLKPGTEATFEVALVKPEGSTAADEVTLEAKLYREDWNNTLVYDGRRYRFESHRLLTPVEAARTVQMRDGRGQLKLTAPISGAYVLELRSETEGAVTRASFYVSGGESWQDNISREKPERLELSFMALGSTTQATSLPATTEAAADAARKFKVGERVGVLVRSPFAGELLLSVETDGVVSTQVVEMTGAATLVPIEVTAACRPNAYVSATVVRRVEAGAKARVTRAYGAMRLPIDPAPYRLAITLGAVSETRPERPLAVKVRVQDAQGNPAVNAAVTLAAVDEGILMFTNHASPDPLGFFYAARGLGVTSSDIYGRLMPEAPRPMGASQVGGDGDAGRHLTAVRAERFKPVALVSAKLHTDATGEATAEFAVPAFSGKLRLMAVSCTPEAVGSAEGSVLVRAPLVAQSSFPRFAAPGDTFEAPVTIFNNSPQESEVKLSAEITAGEGKMPPLRFAQGAEQNWQSEGLRIKAGGQAVVRVPLRALDAAGVAKISLSASMGEEVSRESFELPIRPASPVISRGGYVSVASGAPESLKVDEKMMAGTQRLEVRVTSWPSLQLPEGLDYLERYPYGCAEQTISCCFPLVYLPDLGARIAPGVFEKERVEHKLQSGFIRLMAMQTAEGGLAMWPGSAETWPWASVSGAHLLVEAERAGHAVPADFRDRLLAYLKRSLERLPEHEEIETQAYACYVLALAGKPERAAQSRLAELAGGTKMEDAEDAQAQARLYLSLAWMASGRRDLAAALVPPVLPLPRSERALGGNLGSPVRDRAVLVYTLLEVDPENAALPQLAQQLADSGRKPGWKSTQECSWAVMALGRYLRQAKSQTPFEKATLASGENVLGQAEAGKELLWSSETIPGDLRVQVAGPRGAKAYVSWLQSGVPLTMPAAADSGIKVRRRYLDSEGHPLAGEKVRAGDVVIVELSVETTSECPNLVLEDLLPAGLEVENPRLAMTAASDDEKNDAEGRAGNFTTERLDVRDDRVVIFGTAREGRSQYRYLARAITPGSYVVPPVRGECMYDLSISSIWGGGSRLTVSPLPTVERKERP